MPNKAPKQPPINNTMPILISIVRFFQCANPPDIELARIWLASCGTLQCSSKIWLASVAIAMPVNARKNE